MKVPFLRTIFYFGLSVLILATVFKIQRYPGVFVLLVTGGILQLFFLGSVVAEILTSRTATGSLKFYWIAITLVLYIFSFTYLDGLLSFVTVLLAGTAYLIVGRKQFLTY